MKMKPFVPQQLGQYEKKLTAKATVEEARALAVAVGSSALIVARWAVLVAVLAFVVSVVALCVILFRG